MAVSGAIPQLRTTNLEQALAFYIGTLGFTLAFRHSDFYAGVRAGDQVFHLKLVDAPDPTIAWVAAEGHLHLYFPTDDAQAEAARLQHHGVPLLAPVANTEWGTREFVIRDPDGHILFFGQPLASNR